MEGCCIFNQNKQVTCKEEERLHAIRYCGLNTIIKSSQKRKDTLHLQLIPPEEGVDEKEESCYVRHKSCKATYISKTHIQRYLKSHGIEITDYPARTLRSSIETPSFIWKQHCLFCGEDCDVHRDKKHPDRWRPAYESHTSDRGAAGTFKEAIIKMCDKRDDQWSDEVQTRLSDRRSSYDLHNADARYHDDCRKNFMRIKKQKLQTVKMCLK